jgi:glycosyltransferase involved in cell wall biosynthesis
MRIAILTNSYPPDARGGSGQIAKLESDWLASHGHEVRIWVPAPFSGSANNSQIQVFKSQSSIAYPNLGNQNPLSRLIFHFEDLAPNAELVESIRNFKPDILLTHNLTGCGWGTPNMLKKAGIRWLHILHDVQMIEPSGQIQHQESLSNIKKLWRKFWATRRSRAFGNPDVVISPSGWLLTFHKQFNLFHGSESIVIPNPTAEPRKIQDARCNRAEFDKIQSSVLYVGRVSKEKGAEVLVKAWQNLSPKPGKLKIIGDGPYLETIKQLNDPTIECLGALDHGELAKHYADASLFIFPSLLMENQPTVLLEAMSYGLNIIASDIGGVGELLGNYGTLVTPGNVAELTTAITKQLTKKPDLAKGQEILETHDINRVMTSLSNHFAKSNL